MSASHGIQYVVCYRLEEQEKIRAAVEAENKELRSLNMQLQKQLLKTLNSSSADECSGKDSFYLISWPPRGHSNKNAIYHV